MGTLDDRVVIVTGGGRGIGREHALLFADEGARVVVNDLGGAPDGSGSDSSAAQQVVDEILALGGTAVANKDDIATWDGARQVVDAAVESFGELHAVVNNAGILRDRTIANMSEEEWDSVIRVHLKGHFSVLRWAAGYWRDQAKAGRPVKGAVVNTTSGSGLYGLGGQANYAAAKAGIAALTVVASRELQRYGVRVNAIAPVARTRLTENAPGLEDTLRLPRNPATFDVWDPANISPLAAFLATSDCPFTGQVFDIHGGRVSLFQGWTAASTIEHQHRWSVGELAESLRGLPAGPPELPPM